ncbi:thiamine phosphate synthase [Metallibacterium sp.]|uniref:thiamine phosphate synthase n=1 Tax=Metallibacterium sp. TaxID=2940281 RepID=UPI00262B02D1|nr:thiamine phosphate synthase [Metallibacterium sp.]
MTPALLAGRRGLYAITDGTHADLLARAVAALRGGATVLQYRDKSGDATRRQAEAAALVEICNAHAALCVINDDVDLTQAVGAHGVHLGKHDTGLLSARRTLGKQVIIGVSCYDDLARARAATAQGADYLAFGAFYSSPSKPQARRAHPQLLRDARDLGLPLVAIGGITPDNGAALIAAGADFLAVISGVFAAPDSEVAARRYSELFISSMPKP